MRDLQQAIRQLGRARLFSAGVIVTLALGIGSTVTMFSIVNSVLLRPLPYRAPEELIVLQARSQSDPNDVAALTAAEVAALQQRTRTVVAMGAYAYSEFVVSGDGDAERVIGAQTTANLFNVLGARAGTGRAFAAGEDGPSAARLAILSDGLWARRYGRDASIVGRSIRIDGQPYTVIGVMPDEFEFPRSGMMARSIEIWTPLSFDPSTMQGRNRRSLSLVARMRRGAGVPQVVAELGPVLRRMPTGPMSGTARDLAATPMSEHVVGKVRGGLVAMLGAVVLLLAIVCANTANLMLSRGAARRRSVSIRLALGATRWDVVRPVVIESLLLAGLGGAVGVIASIATRGVLLPLLPESLPRQDGVGINVALLGVAALVSVAVGVVCGLFPAMRLSRENAIGALTETTRATTGMRGRRVQRGLVVAQISVGTVLVSGMAATLISYARLHGISPGFTVSDAITMSVSTSGMRYRDPARRVALVDALLSRARSLPGVRAAATTNILPLGGGIMSASYAVVGVTGADSTQARSAPVRSISDGYFATLGIPMVRGRGVLPSDDATTPRVAVVNDAFARQYVGTTDVIGATVQISSPMVDTGAVTIVGIAASTKERGLTGDATPMIYLPVRQAPFPYNNLVIRTPGAARPIVAAMREELGRLDGDLAIDEVASLTARVRAAYALQAFGLTVVGGFAALAVSLVALGVFAILSGYVTVEMRSIGVRMALGATPGQVQRAVLLEGARLAAIGAGIGIAASLGLRSVIATVARDANAASVGVIAVAASGLIGVALLASWLPAYRASCTDPKIALSAN